MGITNQRTDLLFARPSWTLHLLLFGLPSLLGGALFTPLSALLAMGVAEGGLFWLFTGGLLALPFGLLFLLGRHTGELRRLRVVAAASGLVGVASSWLMLAPFAVGA